MKRSLHKTLVASLVLALGPLTGCAVAVRSVETDVSHPANPRAAVGTAAPTDLPLSSNEPVDTTPAAGSDAPPAHTHHHDS
jgi:hypothetical protein